MKKFLIIFALTLTCVLHAQVEKDRLQIDQYLQILFPIHQTFVKAAEICKEGGFSYFLLKRLSCTDEQGQTLEFTGVPNVAGATLVSETIIEKLDPSMGTGNVNFKFICFEQDPGESSAIHAESILNLFTMMDRCRLEEDEVIEGSTVREVETMGEWEMEIAEAKGPIYLDFYSSRCPPCRTLAPNFAQFSKDFSSSGTFLKVSLENVPEIFDRYIIESMPTLLVFEDQKEVARKSSLDEIFEYFDGFK